MRKYLPEIALVMFIVYSNFLIACTYYKVTTVESIAPVEQAIQQYNRYFIVHQESNAWHFYHVELDNEKKELKGYLETLPDNYKNYLNTKPEGSNRIKKRPSPGENVYNPDDSPVYEVHFYISVYFEDQDSRITIPISSITKIEIYDKDAKANSGSAAFTAIAITAGIGLIIGVIISSSFHY